MDCNKRIEELTSGINYGMRIRHKCNVEGELARMEKELLEIKNSSNTSYKS